MLFADTFAIPSSGIVAVRTYGSSSPPPASLGLGENHPGSCPSASGTAKHAMGGLLERPVDVLDGFETQPERFAHRLDVDHGLDG